MSRWIAEEEAALIELKHVLKNELAAAPQFPGALSQLLRIAST